MCIKDCDFKDNCCSLRKWNREFLLPEEYLKLDEAERKEIERAGGFIFLFSSNYRL